MAPRAQHDFRVPPGHRPPPTLQVPSRASPQLLQLWDSKFSVSRAHGGLSHVLLAQRETQRSQRWGCFPPCQLCRWGGVPQGCQCCFRPQLWRSHHLMCHTYLRLLSVYWPNCSSVSQSSAPVLPLSPAQSLVFTETMLPRPGSPTTVLYPSAATSKTWPSRFQASGSPHTSTSFLWASRPACVTTTLQLVLAPRPPRPNAYYLYTRHLHLQVSLAPKTQNTRNRTWGHPPQHVLCPTTRGGTSILQTLRPPGLTSAFSLPHTHLVHHRLALSSALSSN